MITQKMKYALKALLVLGDEARSLAAIDAGLKTRRRDARWWGDYGSNLRDWAQMYVLLDKHGLKPEGRENLVGLVAAEVEKNRYLSTQEKLSLFLLGRSFAVPQAGDKAAEWGAELIPGGRAPATLRLGGQGNSGRGGHGQQGRGESDLHGSCLLLVVGAFDGTNGRPPRTFALARGCGAAGGRRAG